ncbi:hypothetical protein [Endozoicomonas euniceicola]|uniref:Uncharacterized protein n=1 Tax=Endozoicomonas euniceicola TaxID=1234143 RepID=A0ABY6GXQ2_9GAMM|nr:hypothetical protein [Endozoicomonas euniceicola]UYM17154.1 hypothetical protein NX720_04320 [Endozoicomonas euniceicola]
MRHHYIALKILLGLFLCLAIKTASAYSLAVFNEQITAFPDTEKKIIKLVFDAQPENSQTLDCIVNNQIVVVERNSTEENQRTLPDSGSASEEKAAGKREMELILRPVPGHDNQVVIDLNDNSVITGASGILVELGSSEQSMNFERVLNLMGLDIGHEPTSMGDATMPEFSIFNILTARSISNFIRDSVTGDLRAAGSALSALSVPGTLSMGAVRNSASGFTYINSLRPQSRLPPHDGSCPDRVMWFSESNTECINSVRYVRLSLRNIPVPFQYSDQSVPVTLTYIDRQRINQITHAGGSEVRNEQPIPSDQLEMLARQSIRNYLYDRCLFPNSASR